MLGSLFKKREFTQAEKEAMAHPVSWQMLLLTSGFIVPLLILVFGAQYFFPHNEWVKKYLGHGGTGIMIACVFIMAQLMIWYSKRVSRKAEEEKRRQEQREREIGKIR